MSLGIDLGNEITKTSRMIKFASRISKGHKDMNTNDIKVIYKNEPYTVGIGTPVIGVNRIYSDMYDICLLTAIAKSNNDEVIEENVVLSLPPDLYESSLKKELKEKLSNMGMQEIYIDGVRRTIRIKHAEVFCENSIVFSNPKKYKSQRTLLIDIGGGTTDISEFNGLQLIKHSSEPLGMLPLYDELKKAINAKYRSKLSSEDIEHIIGKDEYEIRQEIRDMSFTRFIIADHVTKICSKVNQSFNYDLCKIELIGGGAAPLINYFKSEYPNISLVEDAQFANSITNETVGEMLWNS
jgi:plasmid segregation protein ParM